jgi:branched-chain amino acid transport system ATP-binding protein
MTLLEIRGLTRDFGGVRAIDGLDLDVDVGEIVSVIGPNGAGKTTLFNLVTGMIPAGQGEILFEGRSIVGLRPSQILEVGIARTFQSVRLFPEMSVRENVMVARHCRTRSGMLKAIFRTPSFRFDTPARSLSYANRRRLEIARAMAADPKVLLLDEPTAGMNPQETQELTELIRRLRDETGVTIVVIEHDMRVVKGVSERVVVLDYGQKIAEGPYADVATNDRVIEAYLGRTATA